MTSWKKKKAEKKAVTYAARKHQVKVVAAMKKAGYVRMVVPV